MDHHFGISSYSLRSLFRDEQRRVLSLIMEPTLAEAEAGYGQIYEHHAPLIRFLGDSGVPIPVPLRTAAEYVLTVRLSRAFGELPLDLQVIQPLLDEAGLSGISLDSDTLEFALRKNMEALSGQLMNAPADTTILRALDTAAKLATSLPFQVNLRQVQNICYKVMEAVCGELRQRAGEGDPGAAGSMELFESLAENLRMVVP